MTSLAGHYLVAFAKAIVDALENQFDYETSWMRSRDDQAASHEALVTEHEDVDGYPDHEDSDQEEEIQPMVPSDVKISRR